FFFQAEDGIRDFHVTGVQTCALPILDLVARADRGIAHRLDDLADVVDPGVAGGVHLDHVDVPALGDGDAGLTDAARIDGWAALRSEERRVGQEGRCRWGRAAAQSDNM